MRIDVLTLFPDLFVPFIDESILGRAVKRGVVEIRLKNIRDYARGRHKVTDDRPYGGGDEDDLDAVRTALVMWRDNHAALEATLRTSPALADIGPISIALTEVSTIGLEALDLANAGTAAKRDWLDLRLDSLQQARESYGQTELMIVDPVVDLVCAVSLPASLTAEGCQEKEAVAAGGEH